MKRFRVLQFNMQFGQRWDETRPDEAPLDLGATIAEIRRHDADLLFLQEVEQAQPNGAQPQPPPNYLRLRDAMPEYDSGFGYPRADPRELPFGIGLAIFSRTPLRGVKRIDVPSPPISFEFAGRTTTPTDRVLLAAATTVLGHEVRLLNTHLLAFFMLGTSSVDHPQQREQVAAELSRARGPTLLAGDFNVRRHQVLVEQFGAHGFATVQDREITWRRQPYVLDHIFYNQPLRCVEHRVIPTLASDHHLLVADFEFA
jgi:endonuclease/exonuclease/phosphatase family metal-dependent hydrolase